LKRPPHLKDVRKRGSGWIFNEKSQKRWKGTKEEKDEQEDQASRLTL